MAKKIKDPENSLGKFTAEDVEKIGFVAKRAAGLPLEEWDVQWWIRDNYAVKGIEFIRKHKDGFVYALELEDGQFYRALWMPGDPPSMSVDIAGPNTMFPKIPDIIKMGKSVISKY